MTRLTFPPFSGDVAKPVARRELLDWDAGIKLLRERLTRTRELRELFKAELAYIKTPAFRKAFEGPAEIPVKDFIDQAFNIIICLSDIRRAAPYRKDPKALIDPIELLRAERRKAIQYLDLASTALLPLWVQRSAHDPLEKYWEEIAKLASRIAAEPFPLTVPQAMAASFDPNNLRRKGTAAKSESAFNGWMVRELARHVPQAGPKRATAISELLALVDVHVTPTTVTAIFRQRTK